MAELTLKDESVLEIGKSVSQSFEGLAKTGKSLVVAPASGTSAGQVNDFIGPRLPETNAGESVIYQTSLLEEISQGIQDLISSFTDMLSFDKKQAAEQDIQERVSEGQQTEIQKEDGDTGFFTQDFKDMMSSRLQAVKEGTTKFFGAISGGLLGKVGLFGLLLAFALNIGKFSKQIGEVIKPIVEGFKNAFTSLKEDFFPLVEGIIETFGIAFETISNLLKGLFQGDGSLFLKGMKGLLFDLPLKLTSILGDAFFSLLDAALNFFGVDSQFVQDVKMFYRELPEKVSELIKNSISFITETIPQFFTDLKDQAIENARNNIAAIKDMFKNAFNFITEDIPNYFSGLVDSVIESIKETVQSIKDAIMAPIRNIKEKVSGVFSGVTDFFTGGDEESKATARAMTGEDKLETLKTMRDNLLAQGPQTDSNRSLNNFRKKLQSLNYGIIQEEGRGLDHQRANTMHPIRYASADTRNNADVFVSSLETPNRSNVDDLSVGALNTPQINSQDLARGRQLNTESAEMASAPPVQQNMQITKGGTNNVNTANNTYTTILEDTNTSDRNLRQYLNA